MCLYTWISDVNTHVMLPSRCLTSFVLQRVNVSGLEEPSADDRGAVSPFTACLLP